MVSFVDNARCATFVGDGRCATCGYSFGNCACQASFNITAIGGVTLYVPLTANTRPETDAEREWREACAVADMLYAARRAERRALAAADRKRAARRPARIKPVLPAPWPAAMKAFQGRAGGPNRSRSVPST